MTTQRNILNATFDAALQLKDAGSISASGAGQVGGAPRVVNLGTGFVSGVLNVDFAAYDRTTGDESYDVRLQVSSDPNFASDVTIAARVEIGTPATTGEDNVPVGGRRQVPFNNMGEDGVPKAYARLYTVLAGTTPSINHQAFISQVIL
jgi:hypothetical protein